MQVLEKGRSQNGWACEVTCTGKGNDGGGCGSRLRVDETDIFATFQHHRDETDRFATIRCIECGVLTDLDRFPSSKMRELKPEGEQKPPLKAVGAKAVIERIVQEIDQAMVLGDVEQGTLSNWHGDLNALLKETL